jgi:hypothetical protein
LTSASLPKIDKCPHCGGGLVVRTQEQNAKLHAILQEISTQRQWAGHWLDAEDWKRLMVAAFERANKEAARIFPAIDGQGIDMIYRRTHRMSKQEMSELIEFATAWAIDNGIRLRALEAA